MKIFIMIARELKYAPYRLFYKLRGYTIGKKLVIGKSVKIEKEGFILGDYVYIGQYSYIGPKTKIGNFCMLSDNVNIIGHDHNFSKAGIPILLAGRPENEPETVIEDDVLIGHAVTIIRGVKIGEGSIVGANSVVTKDIPPYSIFAGNPAKFIRFRFTEEEQKIHKNFLEKYRRKKINLSTFTK